MDRLFYGMGFLEALFLLSTCFCLHQEFICLEKLSKTYSNMTFVESELIAMHVQIAPSRRRLGLYLGERP